MFSLLHRIRNTHSKRSPRTNRRVWNAEPLEPRQMLAADLTIGSASYNSVTAASEADVNISVALTIGNSGDAAVVLNNVIIQARLSTDNIYGNGDDVSAGGSTIDLNLLPNLATLGSVSGSPTLADYQAASFLLIKIDDGNDVAEDNENNNVIVLSLPGLPTFFPSLVPTSGKKNKVIVVDPNMGFSDSDTTNFSGGELRVSVENDEFNANILSMKKTKTEAGVLRIKKGELKLGKNVIGTVSGGTEAVPLVFTFTAEVPPTLLRQIARSVTLKAHKDSVGNRTVQFRVSGPDDVTGLIADRTVLIEE